jgi:WD40 repeat protein
MNRHAFSRNGLWLATAAGPMEKFPELQVEEPEHVVRLRSLLSPGSLGEIELADHDDLITHVTFSPDGNCLATCSLDRVIRLWDLSELNALSHVLARLLLQSDPEVLIREFGFSVQDIAQELAEALELVNAELVKAADSFRERPPQILLADDAPPLNCAFSEDGSWLVSAQFITQERASARLWDMRSKSANAAPIRLSDADAHWLVSIDRSLNEPEGYVPAQSCRIWDLRSPHPGDSCVILPDLDRGVDRIKMTNDNRWLITSSRDGIRAWPLGTEHLLAAVQHSLGREPNEEERRRYSFTTFESQTEFKSHLA